MMIQETYKKWWELGYKIVGHLEASYSKVPSTTPLRKGRLPKKAARKIILSLTRSDPAALKNFRLVRTKIGWVPVCVCGDACTRYHSESIYAIRSALRYLSETPKCKTSHWWWVKTKTYSWSPSHSSIEPCADMHRIPRPLEKVFDGWEGKIPVDQPQSDKAFSLAEIRDRIDRWLPSGMREDADERHDLASAFLTRLASGAQPFPYWTKFELDRDGRFDNGAKKRVAGYLQKAVKNFALDAERRKRSEADLDDERASDDPSPEEIVCYREEVKKYEENRAYLYGRITAIAGKSAEEISALIGARKISDIKTLSDELGIERTKFYREVIYPLRQQKD